MRQVPSRDRIWAVLCGAHKDAHTGRHCGRDKTKENVERNYYGYVPAHPIHPLGSLPRSFLPSCPPSLSRPLSLTPLCSITKKMIDNFLDACPVCNGKRSERRAQLKARIQAKQRALPGP